MADEVQVSGVSDGINHSPAAPAAAEPTAAPSTPEPLTKSDLDAFRSEFKNELAKLTPAQQAKVDAKSDSGKQAPSRPKLKDFAFNDPAKAESEAERYEDAMEEWRESVRESKRTEREQSAKAEERMQANEKGYKTREAEYSKENPAYAADLKAAAGKINVTDPVKMAVFGSKNSAFAVHYMAKHSGADEELNLLAATEGPESVRERIGEWAQEMRIEQKAIAANTEAASAKLPRQNFSKGSKGANHEPTMEERYTRFRS